MTSQVQAEKTVTMRCPDCLNKMKVKVGKVGTYSGKCPVCKASILSKQYSERERHIKIVRSAAN